MVGHQCCLALPPSLLLPLQPDLPADGAEAKQPKAGRQQHQAEVGNGRAVGVEAVGHGRHHNASDKDHQAEGHRASRREAVFTYYHSARSFSKHLGLGSDSQLEPSRVFVNLTRAELLLLIYWKCNYGSVQYADTLLGKSQTSRFTSIQNI